MEGRQGGEREAFFGTGTETVLAFVTLFNHAT
jgi:hypothetical protein